MQKTTYRATIIMTTNPIRIQESLKRMSVRVIYLKSKTKGLFQIAEKALDRLPMFSFGVVHKLSKLVDYKGFIRTCKS